MYQSNQASSDAEAGRDAMSEAGQRASQVITLPEYSWTRDNLRQSGEFVADNIQSMSEGKYPAYYQKAMPYIKENMGRSLKETFYGSPMGGPGVMDQIRSTGAATGVGPKATNAMTSKALQEYSNKSQEIDEFIHQMGVGLTERGSYQFPGLANSAPRGPQTQFSQGGNYNIPGYDNSGMYDAAGQIAGSIPSMIDAWNQGQQQDAYRWPGQSQGEANYNSGRQGYGGAGVGYGGAPYGAGDWTPYSSDITANSAYGSSGVNPNGPYG